MLIFAWIRHQLRWPLSYDGNRNTASRTSRGCPKDRPLFGHSSVHGDPQWRTRQTSSRKLHDSHRSHNVSSRHIIKKRRHSLQNCGAADWGSWRSIMQIYASGENKMFFVRSVMSKLYRRYHRINATSVFISSMPMIFIFVFAKNYLQEKKLGSFENPWTKFFRDHVFSNWDFPSQNLHTKKVFIFPTRVR